MQIMTAKPTNTQDRSRRVDFLDAMRGLAILGVFGFHSYRAANEYQRLFEWNGFFLDIFARPAWDLLLLPFRHGNCGVPIFFVISGFCIHVSHRRKPDPWFHSFAIKRFLRIYPPYLLALLVFSFVYPFGSIDFSQQVDFTNFFAHLTLVHNLFPLEIYAGINPSFWSIAVEAQLYLLFPLMFLLAKWQGWQRTLMVCALIEISIRLFMATTAVYGTELPRWMVCSALTYVFSWSIGAAVAESWLRKEPLPFSKHSSVVWFVVAILCYYFKPAEYFSFTAWSLASASFIVASLEGRTIIPAFPGKEFLRRHLSLAGVISYSFYLIHQPLLDRVEIIVSRLSGFDFGATTHLELLLNLSAWPLIMCVAWVMYKFVEMPTISLARTVASRQEARAAAKAVGHTTSSD